MTMKHVLWGGLGALALALMLFAVWMLRLPPTPALRAQPPIPAEEAEAALAALRPPKRARPLIAIVGINDATETTDYLMPFGILRRADVADVVLLSTEPGPVTLYPALRVEPHATVAEFDRLHREGADYVIVPAMSRDDDPVALAWIRSQAARGATILGICAGAKVVGAAGLLDDRRATTHWYYLDELRTEHSSIAYVADRRIVVDEGVTTTTGITASMPMMLTLIEAIAERERAAVVAEDLGLTTWDARHQSDGFLLTREFAGTVLGNAVAFWNREELGIHLSDGIDEVSLALVADAWSRTYRSRAVTFAPGSDPVQTRNGALIVPDRVARTQPELAMLTAVGSPPARALDEALARIERRYGASTAYVVAMQLEYPRESSSGRTASRP